MRLPRRSVAIPLGAVLVVMATSAAAVPAGSAMSPTAAAPRAAADGILGSFSPLGNGITERFDPTRTLTVRSVVKWDDTIVAGYDDSGTASGVPGTNFIAAWADDTWHALGTGMTGTGSAYSVYALNAWTDDTLVAGGFFTSASGRPNTVNVAAWSSRDDTWYPLGTGTNSDVRALAQWPDTGVSADDTVVAGGFFSLASGVTGTREVAAWSPIDDAWRAMATGMSHDVYSLTAWTDDSLVAGGAFNDASGVANTQRIAVWSGNAWQPLDANPASTALVGDDTTIRSLARFNDSTLIMGGPFSSVGGVAGTSKIAAWSTVDDTWHSLGGGLFRAGDPLTAVQGIAVDHSRGLIYAGGDFFSTPNDSLTTSDDSVSNIAVWDTGISKWIPLRFGTGPDQQGVEGGVLSIALDDSVAYVAGEFKDAGSSSRADGIAKWTWQPPEGSNTVTGGTATITGEGFIGVPASGGVKFGGSSGSGGVDATYTRVSSTAITVAVPAGAGNGDTIWVNGVGGWGSVGTYSAPAPPPPPAPTPPGAPQSASAVAGDGSATVTWQPPTYFGTYPITSYTATSTPGGKICTTTGLTCTVTGLANGTSYTFTVTATSPAGTGAASAPSNAVTPTSPPPPPTPSILITGSRDGQRIEVSGSAMHLTSQTVRPWIKFRGDTKYSEGAAIIPIAADGTFTWSRKTNRKTYVYVAHTTTKSNMVTIRAR